MKKVSMKLVEFSDPKFFMQFGKSHIAFHPRS